jgi:Cu/Ag efflux protein CusF
MRSLTVASVMALFSSIAFAETIPVQGEVVKINEAQKKLTLKHGPIKNLDMESMTMIFAMAEPEVMKTVKVGDKVTFEADRVNGRLTVVKIAKSK